MSTQSSGFFCAGLLALSFSASAAESGLQRHEIAAANVHGNEACAAIGKGVVKAGDAVTLVLVGHVKKIIPGVVEREAGTAECAALAKALLPGPYYRIRLEQGIEDPFDTGILVTRPRSDFRQSGEWLVLSANGKAFSYRFRECNGHETIHSLVFSRHRGKEKLIWHSAYYLEYDIQPSCTNRDLGAMGKLRSP